MDKNIKRERGRKINLKKELKMAVPALICAGLSIAFLVFVVRTMTRLDRDELNTDPGLVVENGDIVNLDYTGVIEDEEHRGENISAKGEEIVIGTGSMIDDFEEQLIGHHVGETVEVSVTFPEDYPDDTLRKKDAVYTTTINGIYK